MKTPPVMADISGFDTWPKLLQHNCTRFAASHRAMRYKRYGIWHSYSWQEYLEHVKYLALGLQSHGFRAGDNLLIVGDNAPEWYFAQMAAQCNRGLGVGLYSDLSADEIEHVARDCAAGFAVVEDEEQADKLMQVRDRLPGLGTVVYWRYKGLSKHDREMFIGLRDVLESGRRYEADHPGVFEKGIEAGRAEDVCAIVYTSGATRQAPKGTLQSYRSLMTNSRYFVELDRLDHRDDIACSLPPAWITEQWVAFGCHLLSGGTVDFSENSETQQEDMRELAPSVVLYSSRLWESQARQAQARLRGASLLKRSTSRWLMPVGRKVADLRDANRKPGLHWRFLDVLGDLVVFRQVRDSLGLPHARVCYTYGTTLSPETFRFFHGLKVPLKTIYGSAEAGAVTGAGEMQVRGTVGKTNPGIEIMFGEEGEIQVRHSGTFVGYHGDEETTARVMDDGWVHTGDQGHWASGQNLVFVDRIEDLITLPCGDVLAPQEVESRLRHSPYIKDAWVHSGQGCDFVTAVIIIDAENTGHWADKRKIAYTTFGDLSQKPEVYGLIEEEIASINQDLPETRQIEKYVNLHKEFDPDESELTRNRKLRRDVLRRRYPDLVEALGADRTSVEVEAEFTYQDGRTGTITTALRIANVGRRDQ